MVVSTLHWPAVHENNEIFKRITWDNILAPLVSVMLTDEHKNKIHQRMRATFNGYLLCCQCFSVDFCFLIFSIFLSFAVEDISFVFMDQSMTANEIKGYFEKTVDEVVDDDVQLGKLVEFMISYCFHAAPRDKTLKEARQVQIDTHMADMHDDINTTSRA
jgi:hypothetical protein